MAITTPTAILEAIIQATMRHKKNQRILMG